MFGYKNSLNYQYLRKQILDLNSDAQGERDKEFTTRKKWFLAKPPGLISHSSASAAFYNTWLDNEVWEIQKLAHCFMSS